MKVKNTHGLISIILFGFSILAALILLFQTSITMGIFYSLFIVFAAWNAIFSYCAKCPSNKNCAHYFPGKAASFCTKIQSSKYSTNEILLMVLSGFVLIVFPNIWLWKSELFLLLFWIPIIIATIEIRMYVCPKCFNIFCPLNRKFVRS